MRVVPALLCLSLQLLLLNGCVLNAPRPIARAPVSTQRADPLPPALPTTADAAPSEVVDRGRLAELPDLIARAEPRAVSGNQSPYVVLGESYDVLANADDYDADGLASWYGSKFHGRATSNGEVFDMYSLSAAHKSLPLPCFVRVTNLNNGRATILRVNDRGPFHDDRLIDLSYAAAVKLGFDLQGTAPVRVEMIAAPFGSPVPRTQLASQQRVSPAASMGFYLQAGAFRSRESAERLSHALQDLLGHDIAVALQRGEDAIHRVRIGPLLSLAEASELQDRLLRANQVLALIVRS